MIPAPDLSGAFLFPLTSPGAGQDRRRAIRAAGYIPGTVSARPAAFSRALDTADGGERDAAAKLCTAYNARTGLTTRFAAGPIKYHPTHVSRAPRPFSRPVRRFAAFRSAHHAIAAAERDHQWGRAKGKPGSGHFRLRFRAVFYSVFGWISRRFAAGLLKRPIVA